MPVEYSYTSNAISACTVQLYFNALRSSTLQLYLYSPQYLYSTAVPLLPSVPVQYIYTSTPPIGSTACTEPQCLYRRCTLPYLTIHNIRVTSVVPI